MPSSAKSTRPASASIQFANAERHERAAAIIQGFRDQENRLYAEDPFIAVNRFENYVDLIRFFHKDASRKVNWEDIIREKRPASPTLSTTLEQHASERLVNYRPGFFEKLFGSHTKKIAKLQKELADAITREANRNQTLTDEHQKELINWETTIKIARGIIAGDLHAYKEALGFFQPFAELTACGIVITPVLDSQHATLNLMLNPIGTIPTYTLSETARGKLSQRDMAISKYYDLYQDHVCSVVLKAVREIVAYLPVQLVVVNAMVKGLNTATGHNEEQVMISAAFTPDILATLNWKTLDPSDALKNFPHQMKFAKTKGFSAVEPLNASLIIQ